MSRPAPVTFAEARRVWARIALLSFGGPAGQIALMHRILIDEKRWIGERRFIHALNFCMVLPGPEAQQLAIYIGWLMHGVRGGLVAGLLFVLPGVVAILALSWIYVLFGHVGPVAGMFFGLKAAVLAIVAQAVVRIGSRALKTTAARVLAGLAFVAIFFLATPFPLIVISAGLIGWLAGRGGSIAFDSGGHGGGAGLSDADSVLGEGPVHHAARSTRHAALIISFFWLMPVALLMIFAPATVWADIASFFSRMAVVTFGGAYAVLAYVAQTGVDHYHWLTAGEMLDGLGLAETTPGPLIMVNQYVGFLAAFRQSTGLPPLIAGTLGALLTSWVTFAPCFVWIFAGAPFVERLRDNRALAAALGAITAAVVGVILNLALWFGLHFLFGKTTPVSTGPFVFDWPVMTTVNLWATSLAVGAAFWLLVLKRGVFETLFLTGVAGVVVTLFISG
jgi:chromate transporter